MIRCEYCGSTGTDARGHCGSCGAPTENHDHAWDALRYGVKEIRHSATSRADPEAAYRIALQLERCESLGTSTHLIEEILSKIYDRYDMDTISLGHEIFDHWKKKKEKELQFSLQMQRQNWEKDYRGREEVITWFDEKPAYRFEVSRWNDYLKKDGGNK